MNLIRKCFLKIALVLLTCLLIGVSTAGAQTPGAPLKTVFVILMENHNWSSIMGNPAAPYINDVLLPMGAHAEQYYSPPKLHPSEPNYIWLEAGDNYGVFDDADPVINHLTTHQHLVKLLDAAGISWKSYQEGIDGKRCPLVSYGLYAAKHNPMVFFNDVTDTNDPKSAFCIDHIRPYAELADDLENNAVARYNFITPDECDDMHNSEGCKTTDSVKNGDTWLAAELPTLLKSQAHQDGGVIMITWDENEGRDAPIGMIVLSPDAKPGYSNTIHYTHSSTLRTIQEIFGVTPLLGDAANATDLSDLFVNFPQQ